MIWFIRGQGYKDSEETMQWRKFGDFHLMGHREEPFSGNTPIVKPLFTSEIEQLFIDVHWLSNENHKMMEDFLMIVIGNTIVIILIILAWIWYRAFCGAHKREVSWFGEKNPQIETGGTQTTGVEMKLDITSKIKTSIQKANCLL